MKALSIIKYFHFLRANVFFEIDLCSRWDQNFSYVRTRGVADASWPWIYQDKSEGNIKSEGKVRPIHEYKSKSRKKHKRSARLNDSRSRGTLRTCAANVYCHTSIDLSLEPDDGETIVNIPRQWAPREFERSTYWRKDTRDKVDYSLTSLRRVFQCTKGC